MIPEPTWFYAYSDEKNFFRWLKSIRAVKDIAGQASGGLLLTLDVPNLDDDDLMDMIALFKRYDLDMSCLRAQLTKDNEHWFKNSDRFWYKTIFDK